MEKDTKLSEEDKIMMKKVLDLEGMIDNKKVKLEDFILFVLNKYEDIKQIDILSAYFWASAFSNRIEILERIRDNKIILRVGFDKSTNPDTKNLLLALRDGDKNALSEFRNRSGDAGRFYGFLIDIYEAKNLVIKTAAGTSIEKVHSKIYIFNDKNGKSILALNGSTNLTRSGLSDSYESTLVAAKGQLAPLKEQFEEVYEKLGQNFEAIDETNADLIEFKEYINLDIEEFLAFLIWIFNREDLLKAGTETEELVSSQVQNYMKLGESIKKYGGAILASSVGTGKSHVIKEYMRVFLRDNKESFVLLIAPKAIVGNNQEDSHWYNILKKEPEIKDDIHFINEGTDQLGNNARILFLGNGLMSTKKYFSETKAEKNTIMEHVLRKIAGKECLIVVDESHHYRTRETIRYYNLRWLLYNLEKNSTVRVILSSATPINNKIEDLLNQVFLAVKQLRIKERDVIKKEVVKEEQGNEKAFIELVGWYNSLKEIESNKELIEKISEEKDNEKAKAYRGIIGELTTRAFWDTMFIDSEGISRIFFKNKPNPRKKLRDLLGRTKNDLFDHVIKTNEVKYDYEKNSPILSIYAEIKNTVPQLNYSIYGFSDVNYLDWTKSDLEKENEIREETKVEKGIVLRIRNKKNKDETYAYLTEIGKLKYFFSSDGLRNLSGQYKMVLVKRAESSLYSVFLTLFRLQLKYRIALLKARGKSSVEIERTITGDKRIIERKGMIQAVSEELELEEDDGEAFKTKDILKKSVTNIEKQIPKSFLTFIFEKEPSLRGKFEKDIELIENLLQKIQPILRSVLAGDTRDEKVEMLIKNILEYEKREQKTLTFTPYAETLDYLRYYFNLKQKISKKTLEKIRYFHAEARNTEGFEKIVEEYSKEFKAANSVNHVLSTDVLGEGVNLGEGRCFINYDLEYNPVRVIQRAGRITRFDWFMDAILKSDDLNTEQTLNKLEKDILIVKPGFSDVEETIASIIELFDDKTELIIMIMGMDYLLLDPKKAKNDIIRWNKLRKDEVRGELQKIYSKENIEKAAKKYVESADSSKILESKFMELPISKREEIINNKSELIIKFFEKCRIFLPSKDGASIKPESDKDIELRIKNGVFAGCVFRTTKEDQIYSAEFKFNDVEPAIEVDLQNWHNTAGGFNVGLAKILREMKYKFKDNFDEAGYYFKAEAENSILYDLLKIKVKVHE